jgi:hypothetical protein
MLAISIDERAGLAAAKFDRVALDYGTTRPARQRRASKETPLKRAKRWFEAPLGVFL